MKKDSKTTVRCAIYTRKSTEEGLDQEYSSLDAQRDAAEAYVASQKHEGWEVIPKSYDDGGFTGSNMERPALRRLLADIEAGDVDCVIVYKVDRLSRSLLDFTRIIETFDSHAVSFVSVTQQFNTATSMGRLVLNVLLSFAQFEREMISERIRDKVAASRRRGKWSGGMPLLGYTVENTKLLVDEVDADRVRQIFSLYTEHRSLLPVVKELRQRGWTTKQWVTKKGDHRGGRTFTKNAVYKLLTNVTYIGKIRYKDETHEGEHDGIVPTDIFQRVQAQLQANGNSGGTGVRNKHNALLKGLIWCKSCGRPMTHSYSCKGNKRYRYYVCGTAMQEGWAKCPAPSVPAGEIERFVVEQIQTIGTDEDLLNQTIGQIESRSASLHDTLEAERKSLQRQLRNDHEKLRAIAANATNNAWRHDAFVGNIVGACRIPRKRRRCSQNLLEPLHRFSFNCAAARTHQHFKNFHGYLTMPINEAQQSKVAALRTEMNRLDPAIYQDIRETYYQIADNLRPLLNALEEADADLGPDGPLLEEHYIFCEMLDRLKMSCLGGVV